VGAEMMAHPDRDEEMIPSLLSFKSHLDTVLAKSFNSDETFSAYLRESFELFINKRRDKPAEYIAKYLDNLLRKGDKGLSSGESSVEEEMDRVLVLFRFVHGKDVFEAFYKKDLAKRLLLAKSASADAERSMLAKLKNGETRLARADGRMRGTIHAEIGGHVQGYRRITGLYEILQRTTSRNPNRTEPTRQRSLAELVAHIPGETGYTARAHGQSPRIVQGVLVEETIWPEDHVATCSRPLHPQR
jgi:Cullin family